MKKSAPLKAAIAQMRAAMAAGRPGWAVSRPGGIRRWSEATTMTTPMSPSEVTSHHRDE